MKQLIAIGFISLSLMLACSCRSANILSSFTTDGCSMFPDKSLISQTNWLDCCVQHDIAYWQGGTKEQRITADDTFKKCIIKKTDNNTLALIMRAGVA
ncbi:hypothetical protein JYT61_01295, partial [bacterium AH-315-E10]|nr:hypothetical protein [bacterium AH-315-E10]